MEASLPAKLTDTEIKKGRFFYLVSMVLKDITMKLHGPSILTLYVLHLGAGNFFVGFIHSLFYLPFAFVFLGKVIVSRMGAVRSRGIFSLLRYVFLLPILLTAMRGFRETVILPLGIVAISLFASRAAFQLAGPSLRPIQGELAGERDPGTFLFQIQWIRSSFTTLTGFATVAILGLGPPLTMYLLFILCGILIGIVSSCLVFKIPEPRQAERGFGHALWRAILEGLHSLGFRRFLSLQFLRKLGTSMVAPFLIVYFKSVYLCSDSLIVLFNVVGGLGSITVSLLASHYLDRVGSKRVLVLTSVALLPIFIPLILAPPANSPFLRLIIPLLVHFLFFFGRTGLMVSEHAYFYASVLPEGRLNLGIASTLAVEASAVVGSLLGGVILTALIDAVPGGEGGAFRIFFLVLALMFIIISLLTIRLPPRFCSSPNQGNAPRSSS